MREIKFRAWDNREGLNKMYWGVSFIPYGEGWHGGNPEYKYYQVYHGNGGFFFTNMGDIVLMQFTGLYDKNNQPIYEGDIVIVENSDNGDNDVTTICKWDNGCFVLEDLAGGHWTRQLFHQPHRLSIAGNQYQNPELIHQP